MNRTLRIALLFGFVSSLPSLSFGWGCSGHEIVAVIAERQLNAQAAQQVKALLQDAKLYDNNIPKRFCDPTQLGLMAFYATWADDFRSVQSDTAPWHFWDVPLNLTSRPALPGFCDQGCVVKAIQDQVAVLKSSASKPEKAKALAFVIHFVGDLHQPLHIITNNDRGGNCVPVAFFGKRPDVTAEGKATPNLHGVWDTEMPERLGRIRRQTQDGDINDFANTLMGDFEQEIADWSKAGIDVTAWALESHDHAVHTAYRRLPRRVTPETPVPVQTCTDDNNIAQRMLALNESISNKYMSAAGPVIEEQLAKGGTRLAMILNDIWK